MSDVVDVLRRARKVIEDEGSWAQGRLCTTDGRHCALGAVAVAVGYTDADLRDPDRFYDPEYDGTPVNGIIDPYVALGDHPAVAALSKAANVEPEGVSAIYLFNDAAEHHRVVLDLFDRAIEQAA